MLIGMMMRGESEKQSLILLNPLPITSQVLNTGDSELCKKNVESTFLSAHPDAPFPPWFAMNYPMPLSTPGCEKPLLAPTSPPSWSLGVIGAEWSRLWSHPMRPPVGCDAKRVRNLIRVVLVHRFQTMNRVHWGCRSLVGSGKGCSSGRLWGYTLLHNHEQSLMILRQVRSWKSMHCLCLSRQAWQWSQKICQKPDALSAYPSFPNGFLLLLTTSLARAVYFPNLFLSWGNAKSNRWTIMVSIRRLKCPRHMTSSLKKMAFSKPLRYGPLIRKGQSVNGEGRKERLEESFLVKRTTKMNQDWICCEP